MAPREIGANQNLIMKLEIIQFFLWVLKENIKELFNKIGGFWEVFMAPKGVGTNQNLPIKLLNNTKSWVSRENIKE